MDMFPSELRSLPHNTPECDYGAVIALLHIPSGRRLDRVMLFRSRCHMLELLDLWNGQQPQTWHYWYRSQPQDLVFAPLQGLY